MSTATKNTMKKTISHGNAEHTNPSLVMRHKCGGVAERKGKNSLAANSQNTSATKMSAAMRKKKIKISYKIKQNIKGASAVSR